MLSNSINVICIVLDLFCMLPSLLSKAFPPYLWKVILLCFIVFNTRETNLLTDYYVLPLRKTSRYTTKNKSLHFTVFSADRVLQPHPLSAAIQWDSPVRLWNERLQTALCLYRKRSWVFLCQVKLWQELKWNNLLCVLNLFFLQGCRAFQLLLRFWGRQRQVSVWPSKGIHRPHRR